MPKRKQPEVIRPHAEQAFAGELAALAKADERPRPERWRLSPWAVVEYICGGATVGGVPITPKYIGSRRLIELAVASLATDRALLLLGVPGTAKTWLSEHLAAAISGDSTLLIQGSSGMTDEALRYGWNYAELIAKGPSERALAPSPVMEAMRSGQLVRIEELTRIPSEVQDALITALSEKTLPIPELGREVQAVRGFNLIATANTRDRGVNELSAALRRRFNTVVLPLPEDLDTEVRIVAGRVGSAMERWGLDHSRLPAAEIRRLVTIFRELRSGITDDGAVRVKSPGSGLSTAEAIDTLSSAASLAAHFGDGHIRAEDLAGPLMGAVVRDEDRDLPAWQEYLEAVVRKREDWADLYRAAKDLM